MDPPESPNATTENVRSAQVSARKSAPLTVGAPYVPTVLPTVGPMDYPLPGYSRNPVCGRSELPRGECAGSGRVRRAGGVRARGVAPVLGDGRAGATQL